MYFIKYEPQMFVSSVADLFYTCSTKGCESSPGTEKIDKKEELSRRSYILHAASIICKCAISYY
jgi:hypothetical protein